jgi:hypothetical protein
MRHMIWIAMLVALGLGTSTANALDPNNCGTPSEPKACGSSSSASSTTHHSYRTTHTAKKHVVHRQQPQ